VICDSRIQTCTRITLFPFSACYLVILHSALRSCYSETYCISCLLFFFTHSSLNPPSLAVNAEISKSRYCTQTIVPAPTTHLIVSPSRPQFTTPPSDSLRRKLISLALQCPSPPSQAILFIGHVVSTYLTNPPI
jgi:hypothetical protein